MQSPARGEFGDDAADENGGGEGHDAPPNDHVSPLPLNQAATLHEQRSLDKPQTAPQEERVGKEDIDEEGRILLQSRIRCCFSAPHCLDPIDGWSDDDIATAQGDNARPSQEDGSVLGRPEATFDPADCEACNGEAGGQSDHAVADVLGRVLSASSLDEKLDDSQNVPAGAGLR